MSDDDMSDEHTYEIEEVAHGTRTVYAASCSCGWRSLFFGFKVSAGREAAEHLWENKDD